MTSQRVEPSVGLAVVGCGAIAEWHLAAIRNGAGDRIKITACVDVDIARAEKLAVEAGATHVFSTLAEALTCDDVAAVDLMLPHHLHEPAAIASLEAGRHVLLEKPLANTSAAAHRILEAADVETAAHGTVFMLAENAQYWPEVLTVKRLLDDGAIGEIITARAWHCFPPMDQFHSGDAWRMRQADAGGGVAIDAGSHWLRPLRMWLGNITEVVAEVGHPFPGMEGESMCRALCRFDSGVTASFDAFMVPGAVANSPLFQITGTLGEIIVEPLGAVRLFDGSSWEGTVVETGNYMASYDGEMADFAAAILDGTPLAASAREGLGELEAALAMYRSAAEHRWEPVTSPSR